MKLGARELLFIRVMVGLLGASYWFVCKKANERRNALMADIRQKQDALADLSRRTAGIDDLNRKIETTRAVKAAVAAKKKVTRANRPDGK